MGLLLRLITIFLLLFQLTLAAGQEFPVPTGPALEHPVQQMTYAGTFESARSHLHATTGFILGEAKKLRPAPYKTVFNVFGGVDPSAFSLFDADTVISVGMESFGNPQQITSQLNEVGPLHTVAAYVAANGYIRSEIGGYWTLGRAVGADFLTILTHVYGGKAVGLKYLDTGFRNVELTVELGGRTRKFYYFQSNMGASPNSMMLENYGAPTEISPALLELLKSKKIDGVLSKASMHQPIASGVWSTLLSSFSRTAVWMGEWSENLHARLFVERAHSVKLQGSWGYQPDNAELMLLKFHAPSETELKAVEPPAPRKGFRGALGRLWRLITSDSQSPPLNQNPELTGITQPLDATCEEFLRNHKAQVPPPKPRGFSSNIQIKM